MLLKKWHSVPAFLESKEVQVVFSVKKACCSIVREMSQRQIRKLQGLNTLQKSKNAVQSEVNYVLEQDTLFHKFPGTVFSYAASLFDETTSEEESSSDTLLTLELECFYEKFKKQETLSRSPYDQSEIHEDDDSEFIPLLRYEGQSSSQHKALKGVFSPCFDCCKQSQLNSSALLIFRGQHCAIRPGKDHKRVIYPRNAQLHLRKFWLFPEAISLNWPVNIKKDERLICTCLPDAQRILHFDFQEDVTYIHVREKLFFYLKKRWFEEAFVEILKKYPFHHEINLLFAHYLIENGRVDQAYVACQRAVHAFQCSFHPEFRPYQADPRSPLGWPQILIIPSRTHQLVHCTLLMYARFLSHYAQHDKALEVYKLLLLMFPRRVVTHVFLNHDHAFMRIKREDLFIKFYQSYCVESFAFEWGSVVENPFICLPNFCFSHLILRLQRTQHVLFFDEDQLDAVTVSDCCIFANDFSNSPTSTHKIFLRALVIFPDFIHEFVKCLNLDVKSSPHLLVDVSDGYALSWEAIIKSRVFRPFSAKLWERKHQAYLGVVLGRLLREHLTQWKSWWGIPEIIEYVYRVARFLIKCSQITWESDKHQHMTQLESFRLHWAQLVISFHEKSGTFAFFATNCVNIYKKESTDSLTLPHHLMIRLYDNIGLMNPRHLGLSNAHRPPALWISLESSSLFVFLISLIPTTCIDTQGDRSCTDWTFSMRHFRHTIRRLFFYDWWGLPQFFVTILQKLKEYLV